jgi:predicted RNA-binding Zn-ribbon protein involved in translation (DUF1610 family)
MHPVWTITLAKKGHILPLVVHYVAKDKESARSDIQKLYPDREIVSVEKNTSLGDAALRAEEPIDLFARSEEIKSEYLESGCQASDVDHAVLQLMEECGELFEDDEAAWNFLMEETHKDKENPNENCLAGFECPECGSQGPFRIDVTWEDPSACRCLDCGHTGTVRKFTGKTAPEFNMFQQIAASIYNDGDHICKTPDDIDHCGDSLLAFIMRELSDNEGCDSFEEALSRIRIAMRELSMVQHAMEMALANTLFDGQT